MDGQQSIITQCRGIPFRTASALCDIVCLVLCDRNVLRLEGNAVFFLVHFSLSFQLF